jgi:hypothetical protein
MNKKNLGGIAILAIASIATFNVSLNSQNRKVVADISLANVKALANGENDGSGNLCTQVSTLVNNKEMCSTNPVRYVTLSGVNYSCKKTSSGSNTCKSGFEGTSSNECTGTSTTYTAPASGC